MNPDTNLLVFTHPRAPLRAAEVGQPQLGVSRRPSLWIQAPDTAHNDMPVPKGCFLAFLGHPSHNQKAAEELSEGSSPGTLAACCLTIQDGSSTMNEWRWVLKVLLYMRHWELKIHSPGIKHTVHRGGGCSQACPQSPCKLYCSRSCILAVLLAIQEVTMSLQRALSVGLPGWQADCEAFKGEKGEECNTLRIHTFKREGENQENWNLEVQHPQRTVLGGCILPHCKKPQHIGESGKEPAPRNQNDPEGGRGRLRHFPKATRRVSGGAGALGCQPRVLYCTKIV